MLDFAQGKANEACRFVGIDFEMTKLMESHKFLHVV